MWRDWGVTRRLVSARPESLTPALEFLALPGELLLIVGVLGVLIAIDAMFGLREGRTTPGLCRSETWWLVGIILGGLALIVFLESLIGWGRPPIAWQAIEPSPYGFPSGHVMAATVTWVGIAWWAMTGRRQWALAIGGILICVVAFARLALGVHYFPDVLAGVVIGGVYLGVAARATNHDPRRAFGLAAGIAIGAVLVTSGGERALLAASGIGTTTVAWWLSEQPWLVNPIRSVLGPHVSE